MPNKMASNNHQLVWMTDSSSNCCSGSDSSDDDKRNTHGKVKGSTSIKRKPQIQTQKQSPPAPSTLVISLSTSEDEDEAVEDTLVSARSPREVSPILSASVLAPLPCREVPLPSTSTSVGNGNVSQENSTKENRPMISRDSDDDSYVTFFDPRVERINLSWNSNTNNEAKANSSPEPELHLQQHSDPPSSSQSSPVPSTSKSCQKGKRQRVSWEDSTNTAAVSRKNKRRRVEDDTSDANNSDSLSSKKSSNSKVLPGQSDKKNHDRIKKAPGSKHQVSSAVKSKVYKKRRPSKSTISTSDEEEEGSDSEGQNKKGQNQSHRKPKQGKNKARIESDDDDGSSSDSLFSVIPPKSTTTRHGKKSKAGQRRSRRLSSTQSKKTVTKIALEQLIEQMERKKNKPKRPSPERNNRENNSDDDESSSSSSSSYQVEIENDASDVPTDFEPSASETPSSSSITSGAETDEVPDLESGSEGEKELRKEGQKDDTDTESDSAEDTEPVSSDSNDGKPPDDGQNDPRCFLCKNLGSAEIDGRARNRNARSWCKCGECSIFSDYVDDYDLICCREIKNVAEFVDDELEDAGTCVTKHPRFALDVLKNEGYARCISKHREPKRFQGRCHGDFWESYSCGKGDERLAERARLAFLASSNPEKLWKSLSSFRYWIFGQRTRMVIPACVMKRVYSEFKVPTNHFKPFKTTWKCPIGRHCRLAFDEQ